MMNMSRLTIIHVTLQWIVIIGTYFDHLEKYSKNWRSHSASSISLSKEINSDSIVDRVMHVYLKDFRDDAIPPSMKIYPLMDFESFMSDIQFDRNTILVLLDI